MIVPGTVTQRDVFISRAEINVELLVWDTRLSFIGINTGKLKPELGVDLEGHASTMPLPGVCRPHPIKPPAHFCKDLSCLMLLEKSNMLIPFLLRPIQVIRMLLMDVCLCVMLTIFEANGAESATTEAASNSVAPFEVYEFLLASRALGCEDIFVHMCPKSLF
jgi:hypothetical protein